MQSLACVTRSCRFITSTQQYILSSSRSRSTTSAIRAGLRAESSPRTRSRLGGRSTRRDEGGDGRVRFGAESSRSRLRSADPSARHGDASRHSSPYSRPSRSPMRQGKGNTGDDQYRRSSRAADRGARVSRHDRIDPYPTLSAKGSPRSDFKSGNDYRSDVGRADVKPRDGYQSTGGRRSDGFKTRASSSAVDSNDLPLSRKERRAAFWEQKQAEDEAAEEAEYNVELESLPGSDRTLDRTIASRPAKVRSLSIDVPTAIKYTTAASRFLYGANTVTAVLASKQRKIYHLYMHKRADAENIAHIRRAATERGIPITRTTDNDLLDRMSEGRPHNGVVLETSPLPAKPVAELKRWTVARQSVQLGLNAQTKEDQAITGNKSHLDVASDRGPVVLLLDGITDPGNVGSIIRSAHFFGIEAVAIATQTCADINSSIVAKASSGAIEAMPILEIRRAGDFVAKSAENGWVVCAAVAPQDTGAVLANIGDIISQKKFAQGARAPRGRGYGTTTTLMVKENLLANRARLVLLGSEGEGLPRYLKDRADILLTIPNAPRNDGSADVGVDSMNVSVAAGIIMNAMVSVRPVVKQQPDSVTNDDRKHGVDTIDEVKQVETSETHAVEPEPAEVKEEVEVIKEL